MGDLTPNDIFPTGYFPSGYFGGASGEIIGELVGSAVGTSTVSGYIYDANARPISKHSGGSATLQQLARIRKRYDEYIQLKDAARFIVVKDTVKIPAVIITGEAQYTPTVRPLAFMKRALLAEDYTPSVSKKLLKQNILRVYDEQATVKDALLDIYDEVA
jgi:hypothetical protein